METTPYYDPKNQNYGNNSRHTNKPNRLIHEKSPYLLQHAYNPVEWYPWGDGAFAKAKLEDKPVFLSIGYSTCHWCHVMERESFEDWEVAEVLNTYFVAVKVDREERPDVDHIYMSVCQAMTWSGVGPLTVIMTPDKKPFFAGTYFPKEGKWGRPGLMDLLRAVHEGWAEDKAKFLESAEEVTSLLKREKTGQQADTLSPDVLTECYQQLRSSFDSRYGGFGAAPKFPAPHNLLFLLRYWYRTKDNAALEMVTGTLEAMRRGGIYDHLGGGFSRYSTDETWLVPHFEKMSYDNSLLCIAYLEAYQCTGRRDFARVAEEIIAYTLRDMTSPEGGFYSAEDADSEGVEGKFYVWDKKEVTGILGTEQGELFCEAYDITKQGNFEGKNILNYIYQDLAAVAARHHLPETELEDLLQVCRRKLYEVREKRIHPFKDDKILTAWNGLMIAAMAKAARVLNKEEYAAAAQQALDFIYAKLRREDGRLYARYREGEAAHLAYIDDYAFLLWGLLELFETQQNPRLLQAAKKLVQEMIRLFWDEEHGGFYFYGADNEKLLVQPKEIYDGAIPSGNSVAFYALLRLARLTDDQALTKLTDQLAAVFAGEVKRYPRGYTFYMTALEAYFAPVQYIVISGDRRDRTVQGMRESAERIFMPDTFVVLNYLETKPQLHELMPGIVAGKDSVAGQAAAYICENFACRSPISSLAEFKQALTGIIETKH